MLFNLIFFGTAAILPSLEVSRLSSLKEGAASMSKETSRAMDSNLNRFVRILLYDVAFCNVSMFLSEIWFKKLRDIEESL